ncbi:AAA family ATPase [Kitasatospora cineracea]|uniref:AAA family ATPase n=1 Tax=Kitasatospora cineracea TaxID=88074 RepID=UPI003429CBD1
MCGLPGSGKSTYAQALERRGYTRLSIDEVVWARTGRDGADLDPAGRREQRHRLRRTAGTLLRRLRGARRRGRARHPPGTGPRAVGRSGAAVPGGCGWCGCRAPARDGGATGRR